MTKILVTYDMFREGFTELESKYEVTFPEGRDFTYEEVLESPTALRKESRLPIPLTP